MNIHIYAKNVYGKRNIYIKDPDIANTVKMLTGKITIDSLNIEALQKLGHTFEVVSLDTPETLGIEN